MLAGDFLSCFVFKREYKCAFFKKNPPGLLLAGKKKRELMSSVVEVWLFLPVQMENTHSPRKYFQNTLKKKGAYTIIRISWRNCHLSHTRASPVMPGQQTNGASVCIFSCSRHRGPRAPGGDADSAAMMGNIQRFLRKLKRNCLTPRCSLLGIYLKTVRH